MKQRLPVMLLCLIAFLSLPAKGMAFRSKTEYILSGKTMGTYYIIKFLSGPDETPALWKTRVDTCLKEVNRNFSMFDPESRLSQFNRMETGKPMKISQDFFMVLSCAERLYGITKGAWDGTVKPLVDLWGFGTLKKDGKIPGSDEIRLALSKTGFHHIRIPDPHTILKEADVTLDLSSIAKGYGVDAVASLFRSFGIQDLVVEIGGEIYAGGKNIKGEPWSVGITRPVPGGSNQDFFQIVRLSGEAIATSGNYRNFFTIGGKTYSHIINPKTGFPIDSPIVSASVISKDCTFADGLATALMVMKTVDGLALVDSLEGTECLIIEKGENGLQSHMSKNFHTYLSR